MSASEKLKALPSDGKGVSDLVLALPQIVAVVEAAEAHVRPDVWIEGQPLHGASIYPSDNDTTASEALRAALTALDEALS